MEVYGLKLHHNIKRVPCEKESSSHIKNPCVHDLAPLAAASPFGPPKSPRCFFPRPCQVWAKTLPPLLPQWLFALFSRLPSDDTNPIWRPHRASAIFSTRPPKDSLLCRLNFIRVLLEQEKMCSNMQDKFNLFGLGFIAVHVGNVCLLNV